ncbi:hypothetical protein SLEP1_g46680 [Rubroshorea leprosula]|uniref:Uncharacterized protein n=1 Tax=Rubroshorea leprosula TaxID=152421 RepID=A0AAV5LN09_9ROSI|nr:hypothetical protein SLEP1_g46680 [Rubroshorea leprosula]
MRVHSQKKKKWVKIDFADGVEMGEHLENKKKWVKIDFAEGEDEKSVCRSDLWWSGTMGTLEKVIPESSISTQNSKRTQGGGALNSRHSISHCSISMNWASLGEDYRLATPDMSNIAFPVKYRSCLSTY